MKRGTKLLILTGVLALVLGAFLLITNLGEKDAANPGNTATQTVFSLDSAKVTKFGWKYSDEVNFTKTENGWVNDADSAFPVDAAVLEKMLTALKEVTASKTIEKPADLDQYGLKIPFCTITVTVDGKTHNLALGDQNEFNGLRYFSNGDGNVYMVADAIAAAFNFGPEKALLLETIPNLSAISGLKVENGDKTYEILCLEESGKTYSDHYKWFMDDKVLDTELTESMLSVVRELEWKSCPDYNATDLAKYGLDNPTVVTVTYQKDKTFVLELGTRTADKGTYVRLAGSNMVYLTGNSISDTLRNLAYNELMPDEVLAMDWDTVTSMDIILGDKTYTLVHEEVPDPNGCATGTYTWKHDGKEIDASKVTDKLDKMDTTGYATGLTPEGDQKIRFVFHRNAGDFSEVELVIYAYNSTACLVTLDGVPTVLAEISDVTSLLDAVAKLFPAA